MNKGETTSHPSVQSWQSHTHTPHEISVYNAIARTLSTWGVHGIQTHFRNHTITWIGLLQHSNTVNTNKNQNKKPIQNNKRLKLYIWSTKQTKFHVNSCMIETFKRIRYTVIYLNVCVIHKLSSVSAFFSCTHTQLRTSIAIFVVCRVLA